jgi:hypothetical protein
MGPVNRPRSGARLPTRQSRQALAFFGVGWRLGVEAKAEARWVLRASRAGVCGLPRDLSTLSGR